MNMTSCLCSATSVCGVIEAEYNRGVKKLAGKASSYLCPRILTSPTRSVTEELCLAKASQQVDKEIPRENPKLSNAIHFVF